ncbi:MAG: hypothetical protein Q8N33_02835 [Rhodocyclaceae bacterium]|nr:hypothetical protein [Rhodocyclaceae bacterium]
MNTPIPAGQKRHYPILANLSTKLSRKLAELNSLIRFGLSAFLFSTASDTPKRWGVTLSDSKPSGPAIGNPKVIRQKSV